MQQDAVEQFQKLKQQYPGKENFAIADRVIRAGLEGSWSATDWSEGQLRPGSVTYGSGNFIYAGVVPNVITLNAADLMRTTTGTSTTPPTT